MRLTVRWLVGKGRGGGGGGGNQTLGAGKGKGDVYDGEWRADRMTGRGAGGEEGWWNGCGCGI